MSKISQQTKSFILLVSVAFLGVGVSLMLWTDLGKFSNFQGTTSINYPQPRQIYDPAAEQANVDTSNWVTFTNKNLGLSFKYNPAWKILSPTKKGGFTVLQIDPGTKYYNIKIYVSPKEFYILDGLPAQSETIGGAQALNANDALFGIVANNLYYTFDVGMSMSLVPEFDALVHSVEFSIIDK